jgi:hypothetical protein
MSNDLTALEESVTEVLLDLMIERVILERRMSTGVQASLTGGVQASPSTARTGTSRASTERRTKYKYDIANAKLVPSILPTYIPPLSDEINRDSVLGDFEYTLVTAYLLKGVCTYHVDQDKVTLLKFCNFNLGDRKAYNMFASYKYLMRTKGKNPKLIPQQWMMNLT